ncbi:rab9 effector protein with kelch motifs isoform X3 [Apus apus]|uniref:rab9 effector protein with kelch motifs isoform X3 n=1 Tax=Apus apus TaxID=8895 RepID=UPI0021F85EBF|nr:rab9 effector protein with kelch motifs isoform X3 [Apus apus]
MGPRPLPLLEPGGRPGRGKWYRLSPRGDRPRGRVGHGCLFLPGGGTGRVLLVGGADPAGAFADAHFVELEIGTWESPEVGGEQPLPRTFHSSSAAVGDCLYVFGGGHRGAEPVQDQQLHVFDTATLTWSQPDTRGDPPSPRQGHVVAAVGTKLFIHGGLAGDVFYDDLFCIDTTDRRWVKIPATGEVPGGRASHSSAVFREHLYIFGGIGPEGALSTTYKYHTEKQQWTLLQFDSPLPAGRLDHAMCVIPWWAGKSGDTGAVTGEEEAGEESGVSAGDTAVPLQRRQEQGGCAEDTVMHLLFVSGGMDTQGQVYQDCLVSLIL